MKYFIPLLFSFFSLTAWSQEKGIVYYGQIKSPTLGGPTGPDLNAYLVFNKHASYYVTAKDSLETGTSEGETIYTGNNGQKAMYMGPETSRYGEQVYYNREKDSLWWSRHEYYVAEKRPVIDWELHKETKEIGKFTAHKATGKFRGRTYTAWYITEIPLPYGPWKLQGLPGLILEAYDKKKEMYLYFKSIEYPTNNKAIISQVKRPEGADEGWHSLQDFEDKLWETMEKAFNQTIRMAERHKKGPTENMTRPDMSEIYIESFE